MAARRFAPGRLRALATRSLKRGSLAAMLFAAGCGQTPPEVAELSGQTMGTSYSIKLSPAPSQGQRAALQQMVDQRLATINAQMSTYLADSDLMRFNQAHTTAWQPVPEALVELVERALRISELSDGRYDITVGPLVNLWGFGNSGRRDTPPPQAEVAELLPRVGYRHLETRRQPAALRKTIAELQIDLSSIAKGWGVDKLTEFMLQSGFDNLLVEIGGEVRAHGEKSPGVPWRIAIEQPLHDRRAIQRIIELRDMAMATSGDYRNFFAAGGQLYSHTIDPTSGQSVRHRLASVTVLADDCTAADAWATALMALGEQRAPRLAEELGIKALFIIRGEAGLRQQASTALADSTLWQTPAE